MNVHSEVLNKWGEICETLLNSVSQTQKENESVWVAVGVEVSLKKALNG